MKLADEYIVCAFELIPIEMEDAPVHTDSEPYCGDNTCSCLVQAVIDGVLTIDEALRIELGEQVWL